MKRLTKELKRRIVKIPRRLHHPLIHHIHKKHRISRKTILYMKEYGPHSHVVSVIIKESLAILILTSIISSIGGISLQEIQSKLLSILPLIILIPALNDVIGDFGTIATSKFTTALFLGEIRGKWWKSQFVHKLFLMIMIIAVFCAIYISLLSTVLAYFKGFALNFSIFLKILITTLLATSVLVGIIFLISIAGSVIIFKRKEDPDNYLIPITTAIADLGSMVILSLFVLLIF